jgi:putative FmdB family regulatory protein
MPTYDYECQKCGHRFDQFQNMSDDPLELCPSCSERALKRLVGGGIGIIFKGSGFYATDSKSSAASKSTAETTKNGESSSGGASSSSESTGSSGDSSESSSTASKTASATEKAS